MIQTVEYVDQYLNYTAPNLTAFDTFFRTTFATYYNEADYALLLKELKSIEDLYMQKFTYLENLSRYEDKMKELFATYEYDLVIYDEIENFQDYNSDQFQYPYSKRKTKVVSLTFDY